MSVLSEEVKKLKKLSLDNLFKADVEEYRYTDIQKLYEAAKITNRMMIEKLKNRQSARTSFSSAIFMDAAFLVADSILENVDVKELFYRLYGGRFPDLLQARNQINNLISRNTPDSLAQAYQVFSKNFPRAGKQRFSFWMFILYDSELVMEKGLLPDEMIRMELGQCAKYEMSEKDLSNHMIYFGHNPSRTVFDSKEFKNFIQDQRGRLADYLDVDPEDLGKCIREQAYVDFVKENNSYYALPNEAGVAHLAMLGIIQDRRGGSQWIHQIICSKKIHNDAYGYEPDVDQIIETYYASRVKNEFMKVNHEAIDNGEVPVFKKSDVHIHSVSGSPRDDYIAIVYLYQIDILYKLFEKLQEDYYRIFSWDKITNSSKKDRLDRLVDDLKKIISLKETQEAQYQREIESLKNERINRQPEKEKPLPLIRNDSRINKLLEENNRLMHKLAQLENENARLKDQLQSRDSYIEELLDEDEESDIQDIDTTLLYSKRYLFVGDALEAMPELKKSFPNSVFMQTATDNISGLKVDYVVILIKWTAHSMYYKVKAEPTLKNVPIINVNTKNINRVLLEMYNGIMI